MAHITGKDRSQLLLLPDAVDDYVGPDNPVRFMDALVDGLDLEAAGFQRARPNDKGRPGSDPADLRDRCTKNTYRRIARYENEATMDRMAERLAAVEPAAHDLDFLHAL